jgi:DNA replication and repair protein RecF
MQIERVVLSNFRNISEADLFFHPQLNFVIGPNGSGKTSLLEGIFLLGRGRSFRSPKMTSVISHKHQDIQCFGAFNCINNGSFTLGLSKKRNGSAKYRFNSDPCARLSDFIRHTVITVLAPDSVQLITGASELRRQFIDWAVFHVEQCSIVTSQRYVRALKQRNICLKQRAPDKDRSVWERELIESGEIIENQRFLMFKSIIDKAKEYLRLLVPNWCVVFDWSRGWNYDCNSLSTALNMALARDRALGYTSVGPHRADFSILINGFPAQEVLSRGQIKFLNMILVVAQVSVQFEATNRKGILLIDDLQAEFDTDNVIKMLNFLLEQGHQLVLTGLDNFNKDDFASRCEHRVFHVEHGRFGTP